MNIAIFGATGPTGQQLVNQALNTGHTVTVLARNPDKLSQRSPNLRVITGNVLDAEIAREVVAGQNAVISTLGVRRLGKRRSFPEGTRNIVQAMQGHGVRRLLVVSSVGIGNSRPQAQTMGKLFSRFLLPVLLAKPFADKARQEQIVQRSSLDWLLVRPTTLTNNALTGRYRVTDHRDRAIAGKIARADVAHFLLSQLADDGLVCQTVTISY